MNTRRTLGGLIIILIPYLFTIESVKSETVRDIVFPVDGEYFIIDNFGEPRNGGRTHKGVDIMGDKMTPLVSAVDGVVTLAPIVEPSWGYAVYIKGDDGYEYSYLHMNNDTPGTDDGQGGPENAYASGIKTGARVTSGQLIGWMGDSGNAESVGAQLHFEIHLSDGTAINPYPSLIKAAAVNSYDPKIEELISPTINDDKSLKPVSNPPCVSGSLIKSPVVTAVYYCGADGKRYVFPNEKVYFSWYNDFSEVVTITSEELAAIRIGGNVTYRPGKKLVKIQSDPKVYAVARGGTLRWVINPEIAEELYGKDWAVKVEDIPVTFFINYTVGEKITSAVTSS